MVKKQFLNPVMLSGFTPIDAGDDEDSGAGSGQSGQNPFPCSYSEWLRLFAVDWDDNGDIDSDDYEAWMTAKGWADQIEIDE